MANDVWGGAPIKLQKSTCLGGNFSQIFEGVISRCIKEEVEFFSITTRRKWHRRNEVVHSGILTHPVQLVRVAVASLDDFKRVNQRGGVQVEASENSAVENWKPPLENTLKINWDAAVDSKKGIVGLGIIVRDERGDFIEAETKYMAIHIETVVAEILATLTALIFCMEQGYQKAILEGDAKQVVNLINSKEPCNCGYGHLVEDIWEGSRSSSEIRFQHVRRTANKAAHELALLARTHVTNMRWMSIPTCIGGIVRDEKLLLST
jgi:ribonuclease HI